MSSYEEDVPERDRQSTSLQSPYQRKSATIADLSLAKLQTRLQAQKGSAKLNLADSFIGDEGCDLVARHLRDNPGTVTVELRGNNITPEGVRRLAPAFKGACTVKHLSLEWNAIGNGTAALCELLTLNSSVTILDLRNNRIGAEGAASLARLIETNRVLNAVDLRWNDLGAEGGRVMLLALQSAPRTLASLELSGNKVPDDILQAIDSLLRGKPLLPEPARLPLESPRPLAESARTLSDSARPLSSPQRARETEPLVSARLLTREKEYTEELQSKYEANMFAQSRLEARNAELEQLLDQERKRSRDIQSELMKELDTEKMLRAQAEEALMSHKEEVVKREVDDERTMQDLDVKLSSALGEKGALGMELNKLQDQYEKLAYTSQERLKALEERLTQQQRLYAQLDTDSSKAYELLKLEHQQTLRDIADENEERTRIDESKQMSLAAGKEAAETECKKLRTALAQVQTEHMQDIRDLEARLRDESERKFSAAFYMLEEKMKAMEDARSALIRKNQDLQRDMIKGEKKQLEQVLAIEAERNQLLDERSQLRTQIQQLQATIENLKNEVYALNTNLQSGQRERDDLSRQMVQRGESSLSQLDKLAQDQAAERKQFEELRDALNRRILDLEGRLTLTTAERDRIKDEYARLHENLRVVLARTVQDTMLDHMRKLEAEKLGK